MISNEQIICSYIKEIKHHLPIYKSEEKKFINDLQNAIMDFSIFSIGAIIVSLAIVIMFQFLFYYYAHTSYISREITIIEEDNNK